MRNHTILVKLYRISKMLWAISLLLLVAACTIQPLQTPEAPQQAPSLATQEATAGKREGMETPQHAIPYNFYGQSTEGRQIQISLDGFDISDSGEQLTLYWRAVARPTADYTAVVRLISASGQVEAELEQVPDPELPTTQWQPDYKAADLYLFDLKELPHGAYLLQVGLYDPATGEKMNTDPGYWEGVTLALLTVNESTSVQMIGPDCQRNERQFRCRDAVMGAEFAYPTAWGAIESTLRPGGYEGTLYHYLFNPEPDFHPMAGGLSQDFSEGRGGAYTDFRGFEEGNPQQLCANQEAIYCDLIADNVLIFITDAPIRFLCEPGPAMMAEPLMAVAINLGKTRPIQGFIFLSDLLSREQVQQLHNIAGFDGSIAVNCDAATQNRYNDMMQQIMGEIQAGTSDIQSQQNFQAMLDLANSIAIDP